MPARILEPRLDLLGEEYVLVQAWKKASAYIRYHNWYSDTLELDRGAVDLKRFLGDLSERLLAPRDWLNDPLRIVPAPKSQPWKIQSGKRAWRPVLGKDRRSAVKIRPLAYATLKDQVAATAVMLCLADRAETAQGSTVNVDDEGTRRRTLSYGNRLLCDCKNGQMRHRWGSARMYRAYFQDYRAFLRRPEEAVRDILTAAGNRKGRSIVIVRSDLQQFYDRVRSKLLARKINQLMRPTDDPGFYVLAKRLLNWRWHSEDKEAVAEYQKIAKLKSFDSVALPQGLVAAGFFANVTLLDFDDALRRAFSMEIAPGVWLRDVCRYVDDLRFVLEVDSTLKRERIKHLASEWTQKQLDATALGLRLSEGKTEVLVVAGQEPPEVLQSKRMERVQTAISGGFDPIGGEEILNAVQGLLRSQQRFSKTGKGDHDWQFTPIPDVRDETVARFAAGRFRSTFRSLRPMLAESGDVEAGGGPETGAARTSRTREDLDGEAKTFAFGLIENWIKDPSNVRLLRIGLDIWPERAVLESILKLLRPYTLNRKVSRAERFVAWYCLAEIFRAGATETGIVEDGESLPLSHHEFEEFRNGLRAEALRLERGRVEVPWYVRQQVLLFLAANDSTQLPLQRFASTSETRHYVDMIHYLAGKRRGWTDGEFCRLAILARRSFRNRETAAHLARRGITATRLAHIASSDPSFALEIVDRRADLSKKLPLRARADLCLLTRTRGEWLTLPSVVLEMGPVCPLRNELTLLRFAEKFLRQLKERRRFGAVTPSEVLVKISDVESPTPRVREVRILARTKGTEASLYDPPRWTPKHEQWRFQLGFLLRFILSARQDFTQIVRPRPWREQLAGYRPARSHWFQRLYGLYNGHDAFGDDWLPISDWTERLLMDLLRWPGFSLAGRVRLGEVTSRIQHRLHDLLRRQGEVRKIFLLPQSIPLPEKPNTSRTRPLRACVVQTVVPEPSSFKPGDLSLRSRGIRRRHRTHLSAALAAVERMLALRETHLKWHGRLDWLILPELSVHPRDVKTHLVPFARKYKTIILAGLTYEKILTGLPMVNSAIWIVPVWSPTSGLQILIRRQGKEHLSPVEQEFNSTKTLVDGFRPCQWLMGYQWSGDGAKDPMWLTAAICYDATDLSLVAALRNQSDVFAVPSLNMDVKTFDQMALALHYHMFQMVIVANSGLFGGSNAYVPYQEFHIKQVFHLHGQPQASIAFLEIEDIGLFLDRTKRARMMRAVAGSGPARAPKWKFPPAGV